MTIEDLQTVGLTLAAIMGGAFLIFLFLLVIVLNQFRNIKVPPGAGFSETLHYTPFLVVLMIDMLDLSLDFLAAPLAWLILDRLGLKALRGVSALEAVIPGTQLIPTLTLAWVGVRLFGIQPERWEQANRDADALLTKGRR